MSNSFTLTFTAGPEHIDINGHVNNMVWLQWVQDIATAHWERDALPEHVTAYLWFVTRHEIDYRGNIGPGETVTARTYIPEPPSGARFLRCVDFTTAAMESTLPAIVFTIWYTVFSGRSHATTRWVE